MINARILVRKGLKADFDPTKMLPGEWAVSIDSSTSNQIVWMCFAPGVCKRMGTYEDFQNMVYNATGQIIERYEDAFGSILEEVNTNAEAVSANTDIVLVAKSDIINTYLPQIKSYVSNASTSASNAKTYSENAKASASEADKSAEDAKKYSQNAFSTTPEGYEVLVGDVDLLKNSIIQTTDRTLYGSKEGGIKLIGIGGASEQKQYSGKNLLDLTNLLNSASLTANYSEPTITFTKTVASQYAYARYGLGAVADLDGKTVYLKCTYKGSGDWTKIYFGYTTEDGVDQAVEYTITDGEVALKFTVDGTNREGKSVMIWFYPDWSQNGAIGNVSTFSNVMVSTEENADYEPYVGGTASPNPSYPQEIESVGDSGSLTIKASNEDGTISKSITIPLNEPLRKGDKIAVVDSVWGINRKMYRPSLADKTWRYYDNNTAFGAPLDKMANIKAQTGNAIANSLCTHATISSQGQAEISGNTNIYAMSIWGSDTFIYFNSGIASSVDAFVEWLTENGVEVIYEVATPTFEPFTDQTPFYGLESFDTVTYISTDSEVEPSIELKFGKTEVGALTLGNYNGMKLNEIRVSATEALLTELSAALVAGSEV